MQTDSGWRGDREDDDRPKFGREGRAWLRRRIRALLFRPHPDSAADMMLGQNPAPWSPEAVATLLDWYAARARRFVIWTDDEQYHGPRFSSGAWTLDPAAILVALCRAVDDVERELDATRYPSLAAWLAADIADELMYAGDPGGMPRVEEVGRASDVLSRKRCSCGARFTPERRNGVRCPACVEQRKADTLARLTAQQRRRNGRDARD